MKPWIRRNKIYFETAAATLLSAMAILVSIAQLSVSSKQNELAKAQLRVAKATIAPIISIKASLESDTDNTHTGTRTLTIKNIGGPAFEAKVRTLTFLNVRHQGREPSASTTNVTIRVLDYFNTTYVTQAPQGNLFTVTGRNNYLRMTNLQNSLQNETENPPGFSDFELEHFVEVSYRDSIGDRATIYFRVDEFGVAQILSENDGKRRFANSNEISFGPMSQSMDKLEAGGLSAELSELKNDT